MDRVKAVVGLAVCLVYLGGAGCRRSRESSTAGGKPRTGSSPEQRAGVAAEVLPSLLPLCQSVEPAAPKVFGGTLKVLLEHEPAHLDPLDDPSQPTLDVVSGLIYEPLLECVGGQVRGALAERWEWTA